MARWIFFPKFQVLKKGEKSQKKKSILSAILECPEWGLMMEGLQVGVSTHYDLGNVLSTAFVSYDGTVGRRNRITS